MGDLGRRSFGHSRTQVQPRTRGDSESWSRLVKNPPADCRVPPKCKLQLRSSVARRARAGAVCSRCTIRIASGATYALWWREHAQRAMMPVILTDVVRYVALGMVIWVQNSGWHVLPLCPCAVELHAHKTVAAVLPPLQNDQSTGYVSVDETVR